MTSHKVSRLRIGVAFYAIGSVVILVLYSSWMRPIWYDEMVTFAIAGVQDPVVAIREIVQSTTNLNQGTTGVFLLSEYLSLRTFGSHFWSLRLPSLIFGAWSLTALLVFLAAQQVRPLIIGSAPFLMVGFPTLWYFIGEARTYIPLVAAVLGMLGYYSLSSTQQHKWSGVILGWGSLLIGVLFHPYFLLYWPAIAVSLYWARQWSNHERVTLSGLFKFARWRMVLIGGGLGFTIGAATWMRGKLGAKVPWDQWLSGPIYEEVARSLAWPYFEAGWLGVFALLIIFAATLLGYSKSTRRTASIIPPLVLATVAVVAAYFISAISILNDFWVFQRQWVASQALMLGSILWLMSRIIDRARESQKRIMEWLMLLSLALLVQVIFQTSLWKASQIRSWSMGEKVSQYGELSEEKLTELLEEDKFPQQRQWIEFAQANLMQGGQVWEVFGEYYVKGDWDQLSLGNESQEDLFLVP